MSQSSKHIGVDIQNLKQQISTYKRLLRRVTPGPWFEYRGLIWSETRNGQTVASLREEDLVYGKKTGDPKESIYNGDYIAALNPLDFQKFLSQVEELIQDEEA